MPHEPSDGASLPSPRPPGGLAAPGAFLALTVALSIPFWVLGALRPRELLPGLPVSALMTCCPAAAALVLTRHRAGGAGARALLHRAVDVGRVASPRWLLAAALLIPALTLLGYGVLRVAGRPLPPADIAPGATLALTAVFLVAALGEELGWTGYALPALRAHHGPWSAALTIGLAWAAWHVPSLVQAGRAVGWIAWWALGTVAMRVLLVWLHERGGESVFLVALAHATSNVAWQSFPVHGSHYDVRVGAVVTLLAAALLPPLGGGGRRDGGRDGDRGGASVLRRPRAR